MSKFRNMSSVGLTTRSVLLSVLLGSHPPALPVAALVEFGTLFGIAGGTVRTALSRMVDRGDLTTDDGVYRLRGDLVVRQAEQDAGRHRPDTAWDASWFTAIVVSERRDVAERRTFRARAVGAKLGELRVGAWMRPANIEPPDGLTGAVIVRGPLLGGDDVAMAQRLWDLPAIDRLSRALVVELDDAGRAIDVRGSDAIPHAFGVLARALRHLRVEPQLPDSLHPATDGDLLRRRYDEVERRFRHTLADFLRA